MSPLPSLDDKCGENFRFRDFVECGETFQLNHPNNVPLSIQTYGALEELAKRVLDPVWSEFGELNLTYGMSCPGLYRLIDRRITPSLDQHASYELNSNGSAICKRGGAAADFSCLGFSSLRIAQWIVKHTQFDRLYFYGSDRPLHVSVGPEENGQVVLMPWSENANRRNPRRTRNEVFLGLKEEDDLIIHCLADQGGGP